MSVGGVIGGIVGGVAGFFIGGPLGAATFGAYMGAGIGMGIGMALDPIAPDSKVGQTPTELQMTGATRGVVLTELDGAAKLNGTIVWYGGSRTVKVESDAGGGKK